MNDQYRTLALARYQHQQAKPGLPAAGMNIVNTLKCSNAYITNGLNLKISKKTILLFYNGLVWNKETLTKLSKIQLMIQ